MSAARRLGADPQPPQSPQPAAGLGATGVFPLRRVRCECAACGVHTIVTVCVTIGGCCHNCGSYELRPVSEPGSPR